MSGEVIKSVVIEIEVRPKDVDLGPIAQKINELNKLKEKGAKQEEATVTKVATEKAAISAKEVAMYEKQHRDQMRAIQEGANADAKFRFKKIQLAERLAVIERKHAEEMAKKAKENAWTNKLKEGAEKFEKKGIMGTLGGMGPGVAVMAALATFKILDASAGELAEEFRHFKELMEESGKGIESVVKSLEKRVMESGAYDLGTELRPMLNDIISSFTGIDLKKMGLDFGASPEELDRKRKVTTRIGATEKDKAFQDKELQKKEDDNLRLLQLKEQQERKSIDVLKERTQVERELIRAESQRMKDFRLEFGLMNREQQNQIKDVDAKIKSGGISSLNKEELDLAKQAGLHKFQSVEKDISANATAGGFDSLNVVQQSMALIARNMESITNKVREGKEEFKLEQTIDVIVHGLNTGEIKSELKDAITKIMDDKIKTEIAKIEQARNAANAPVGF